MRRDPLIWLLSLLVPRAERSEVLADLVELSSTRGPRRARVWLAWQAVLVGVRLRLDGVTGRGVGVDLRAAWRQARRSPSATTATVSALALGIGTSTAVFSLINAVFFAPMGVLEPSRLVLITESLGTRQVSASYPNFLDLSAQSATLAEAAVFQPDTATLRTESGPARLRTYRVSSGWSSTLGAVPLLGRTLTEGDHVATAPPTVVISHRLWRSAFGGDPGALHRSLVIDDAPYEVVGVMPPDFEFYRRGDAWIPLELFTADAGLLDRAQRAGLSIVARLAPSVTLDEARHEATARAQRLASAFPEANTGLQYTLVDLRTALAGPEGRHLWLLLAVVLSLLALGALNAATLVAARLADRRHELAVRLALGASGGRISRQLIIEGLGLGVAAGATGTALAVGILQVAVARAPAGVPGLSTAALDHRVLLFALALSLLLGLALGLGSAKLGRGPGGLMSAQPARTATGAIGGRRVRSGLVFGQVALSLVIVSSSAAVTRTIVTMITADIGFSYDQVLAVDIQRNTSGTAEEGRASTRRFHTDVIARLSSAPGIRSVAVATPVPLSGSSRQSRYWIEGLPYTGPTDLVRGIDTAAVSGAYFTTMGIPLTRGRTFDDTEHGPVSVAIVDETFAERFWPGTDPVGKRLMIGPPGNGAVPATVIGVAGAVRQVDAALPPRAQVYVSQRQWTLSGTLLIRTDGDPGNLVDAIRAEITAVDPAAVVWAARPLREVVASSWAAVRFTAEVLSLLAAVGLLLSGLGVAGLVNHDVAQRQREIGIRLALGDTARGIRWLVLRRSVGLVGVATIAGGVVSMAAGRAMAGVLPVLAGPALLPLVSAAGIVLAAGVLASAGPALRASRVNPIDVIRRVT